MALVTVQRSPTPSTTSSPCASVSPSRRPLSRFCHCGSALPQRVPPSATAHAPRRFPGLGTRLPGTPPPAVVKTSSRNYGRFLLARITPGTELSQPSPRALLWHACLRLEHFLSGMSHSGFSPSPFLPSLGCSAAGKSIAGSCAAPCPHPFRRPLQARNSVHPSSDSWSGWEALGGGVCVPASMGICCLSRALFGSGFTGLPDSSYSLIPPSPLPPPHAHTHLPGWPWSLFLGRLTSPHRLPKASGATR